MSIFDVLRTSNSIEADMSPEAAPALAAPAAPGLAAAQPGGMALAGQDPANVASSYYIERAGSERRYYSDLAGKQLAFKADNKAITTKQENKATVASMLDVAQAAGWKSMHVRGTAAFKREAWIEAQSRGMAVKGYEATADDRRDVMARREAKREPVATAAVAAVPLTPSVATSTTPAPAPAVAPEAVPVPPAPAQPAAAAKPRKARAASQTKAAAGAAEGQANKQKQPVERKPVGEAKVKATEADADAGRPVERAGEAKREAPAAKPEGEPKKYPDRAREPWMEETGGLAALAPAQQASAERSHERWLAGSTAAKPRTMELDEYVGHVQGKRAEAKEREAKAEEKRASDADLDARSEALEASRDRGPSDPKRMEEFADQLGRDVGHGRMKPAQVAVLIAEHVRDHAVTAEPDKLCNDLLNRAKARAVETVEERVIEAKAGGGVAAGEAKPATASRETREDAKPSAGVKLSPAGAKVLAFLEERIETQMGKIDADARADLRTHAAQAIAKREAEVGPIKMPTAAPTQKRAAKQDQAKAAPKQEGGQGQQPAQVQQPRMSMGQRSTRSTKPRKNTERDAISGKYQLFHIRSGNRHDVHCGCSVNRLCVGRILAMGRHGDLRDAHALGYYYCCDPGFLWCRPTQRRTHRHGCGSHDRSRRITHCRRLCMGRVDVLAQGGRASRKVRSRPICPMCSVSMG